MNFQDNKNSDDVSFLKAILLSFSSHLNHFHNMHQNKQTFMFVFTLILNMLPDGEYKMPCHFSMRKICQFLSIQHKSLMSASASEVFTFSPNTTPISRKEFAYPINHGFFHETFSRNGLFYGLLKCHHWAVVYLLASFSHWQKNISSCKMQKDFRQKRIWEEEKKCKAKQLFSSFMKKRKFFHMMYFMLTFPKKGEKGVYFNIWNTRLGLILSLIASLAMT